jgi:N-sulfoglucosamine sulfohydrolase
MIVTHDLGDYLGCFGRKVASPNLDRFAAEGVRFTSHFCTSPFCSPSRGSIITGLYPHSSGLMGLCNLGWSLPEHHVTDARRFEESGYRTYLVGFQHETRSPEDLGFQHNYGRRYITASNYNTDYVAESVNELLRSLASERTGSGDHEPFYLRIGTYSVHRNLFPVSGNYGYDFMHDRGLPDSEVEVMPQWMDTPGLRYDLAGFTGEVSNMDRGVGTILDSIRAAGFEENTLVVFTTDHGIDFPRAKGTLYDLGTRTALLMRYPPRIRRGTVVNGLSSHVDVVPTLVDACGLRGDSSLQGVSLMPMVDGRAETVRDEAFAEESTYPGNLMRAVRTERHKLIHNYSRGRRTNATACGATRTDAETGEFYFVDRPAYELYDLAADPAELNNLSGSAEYRAAETELRERLDRWLLETDDPILTDSIRRPVDEYELFARAHPRAVNEHSRLLWERG